MNQIPTGNRVACPAGKFRQGEALTFTRRNKGGPPYVRFSHTAPPTSFNNKLSRAGVRKVMG